MNTIARRKVRKCKDAGKVELTFVVLIDGQLVQDVFGDTELGTTKIEYENGMEIDDNIVALSKNLLGFILNTPEPEYTINRNIIEGASKLTVILKAHQLDSLINKGYSLVEGRPEQLQKILTII